MSDTADRHRQVRDLLLEAAETHHRVYRLTDGADDDWATWYADWLATRTELPEVLGRPVVRSELTHLLVGVDRAYAEVNASEPWEDYYARALVDHFTGSGRDA